MIYYLRYTLTSPAPRSLRHNSHISHSEVPRTTPHTQHVASLTMTLRCLTRIIAH